MLFSLKTCRFATPNAPLANTMRFMGVTCRFPHQYHIMKDIRYRLLDFSFHCYSQPMDVCVDRFSDDQVALCAARISTPGSRTLSEEPGYCWF